MAYSAKTQVPFLKKLKCNLSTDELIASLDFTQNYSYIVQDEVQSFHWNNSQSSLQSSVIYYLDYCGQGRRVREVRRCGAPRKIAEKNSREIQTSDFI